MSLCNLERLADDQKDLALTDIQPLLDQNILDGTALASSTALSKVDGS
jgi:hypothetical protein